MKVIVFHILYHTYLLCDALKYHFIHKCYLFSFFVTFYNKSNRNSYMSTLYMINDDVLNFSVFFKWLCDENDVKQMQVCISITNIKMSSGVIGV